MAPDLPLPARTYSSIASRSRRPAYWLVQAVGDKSHSTDALAAFERHRRDPLDIDGGHLLAFPKVANCRVAQRCVDLEGHPGTGAAAIQAEHQSGPLRRAAIDMGKDAQASPPAAQQRLAASRMGESGPPHQRPVPEHPEPAVRRGRKSVPADVTEPARRFRRRAGRNRGSRILALGDDPSRIARVRVNWRAALAVLAPDRSLQRGQIFAKWLSISSTASLFYRKTSRHIVGSDAAMRVESRNPPAENLITSDCVTSSRSAAAPTRL